MGRLSLGESGDWIWICLHSCECGRIYLLVRVGISTLFPGNRKFISGSCKPRAQGDHLLRRKRVWSVYFKQGMVWGMSSYFPYLGFPAHWQAGGRCMFWHLYVSLWRQQWCHFGVDIDDVSRYLRRGLPHGLMWHWWWHLSVLILFCTDLSILFVCPGKSRMWNIFHHQDKGVADFIVMGCH